MADGFANRINADPVDGTPTYSAQAERLFAAALLMPGSSALRARGGVRLGGGFSVSVAGDSTSVTVQPGVAVIDAPNSSSGPYIVAIPTAKTLTMPAKPGAGLSRNDRVVVRVYDEDVPENPTTLREARVELVTGTAASSPAVPAVPTMALSVAQLNTTSTTTTLTSNVPWYSWAAGAVGVCRSQADRDSLTPYDGLVVYREDLDTFEARVNGAWVTFWQPAGVTPFIDLRHNTATTRTPGNNLRIAWATTQEAVGGTSLSGSQITLPAGVYTVTAQITADWDQWPASLELRKNSAGSATAGSSLGVSYGSDNHAGSEVLQLSRTIRVNAGDHVEVFLGNHVSATMTLTTTTESAANYFTAVRTST